MDERLIGGPIPDAYVNLPGRSAVSFAIPTHDWERDGKPQNCRLVSVSVARVRCLEIDRPGEVSSLTIASAGGVPDWYKPLWDLVGDHDNAGWPGWRLNAQTLEFEPQHAAPMYCRIFMEIDAEDPDGCEMWWWWIGEKCVRRDYRNYARLRPAIADQIDPAWGRSPAGEYRQGWAYHHNLLENIEGLAHVLSWLA